MQSLDDAFQAELDQILESTATAVFEAQDIDTSGWSAVGGSRQVDVWTTAQVVLWMDQVGFTKNRARIDGAVRYLLDAQGLGLTDDEARNVDDGWGWQRTNESDSTATSLAIRALLRYYRHLQGSDPLRKKIQRAIIGGRNWLIANRHPDGGFALLKTDPKSLSYNTCWCSIALAECAQVSEFQWPAIVNATRGATALVESTGPGAGWGREVTSRADPLGVAYCTYLLQSFNFAERAAVGIDWLKRHQEDDGFWKVSPDDTLEPTAWALIILLASRERPDTFRIQSAVKYLRELYIPGKGWPQRPQGEALTWSTYYAFLALSTYRVEVKQRGL